MLLIFFFRIKNLGTTDFDYVNNQKNDYINLLNIKLKITI